MPAGFNKGQIEYIKTIASVNDHDSYKRIQYPSNNTPYTDALDSTHDSYLTWKLFTLDRNPRMRVPNTTTPSDPNDIGIYTSTDMTELDCFSIPIASNSDGPVAEGQRVGVEGFLESTHLRIRCTLVHQTSGDFNADHGEYRMIVFRARDRQHSEQEQSKDDNNPFYNLFRGIGNYNIGFKGYEAKERLSGTVKYGNDSSATNYDHAWISATGAMTAPVNKESWVVMKDHRFFLGREYGGKNLFETTLHWNWKDPIATTSQYVTDTDNDKNYAWYILIMGLNNNASTTNKASLGVKITGTTHMTSG